MLLFATFQWAPKKWRLNESQSISRLAKNMHWHVKSTGQDLPLKSSGSSTTNPITKDLTRYTTTFKFSNYVWVNSIWLYSIFQETLKDNNETKLSVLRFKPKREDNGKRIRCLAENTEMNTENARMEDSIRLSVSCKHVLEIFERSGSGYCRLPKIIMARH